MSASIIPIILTTTLLVIFATAILMLLVLTERNRLQKTLAAIMGAFGAVILAGLINRLCHYDNDDTGMMSVLNFRLLATGFIGLFSIMSYYMVAAHRNLLTTRRSLLLISPVIITLVVYVVWHLGTGEPMNHDYHTFNDLWENRYTVPVMLRVLMYLFFVFYQGMMFADMWHLDSLRNKHSVLNSPDAVSNIRWLRMVVFGLIAIFLCYSLMLFVCSVWAMAIYLVVTAGVFIFFTYNAIARRMYEDTNEYQLTWNAKEGWKVGENESELSDPAVSEEPQRSRTKKKPGPLRRLDDWMNEVKPFCRPDFSVGDLYEYFGEPDHGVLIELLRKRGENPQSYIRRCRIEEACRLIREENLSGVYELSCMVGFAQQSSFSRAFSAVTGKSPMQYMHEVKPPKHKGSRAKNK